MIEPGTGRPYLVFFRAGPASLHRRIIAEDPARNWDCVVNWWSVPPDPPSAELELSGGLNKADGFFELSARGLVSWRGYRYILLLDDDVYFAPGDVSRLLRICDEHGTYLAQPALRWGTYASHPVTLRNPLCRLRATSFVEIMAPVFSCAALEDLLDTFTLTKSTWGIDWAWSSRLSDKDAIRIVDAVVVDHTKALSLAGGAFYARLREMGIDPRDDLREVQQRFAEFGGIRTLGQGHTLRAGVPRWAGRGLVWMMDRCIRLAHSYGWSEAVVSRRPSWRFRTRSASR